MKNNIYFKNYHTYKDDDIYTVKRNLSSVTDPTFDDDETKGYHKGSIWCNQTTDNFYLCIDPRTGSAIWQIGGETDLFELSVTSQGIFENVFGNGTDEGGSTVEGYESIWDGSSETVVVPENKRIYLRDGDYMMKSRVLLKSNDLVMSKNVNIGYSNIYAGFEVFDNTDLPVYGTDASTIFVNQENFYYNESVSSQVAGEPFEVGGGESIFGFSEGSVFSKEYEVSSVTKNVNGTVKASVLNSPSIVNSNYVSMELDGDIYTAYIDDNSDIYFGKHTYNSDVQGYQAEFPSKVNSSGNYSELSMYLFSSGLGSRQVIVGKQTNTGFMRHFVNNNYWSSPTLGYNITSGTISDELEKFEMVADSSKLYVAGIKDGEFKVFGLGWNGPEYTQTNSAIYSGIDASSTGQIGIELYKSSLMTSYYNHSSLGLKVHKNGVIIDDSSSGGKFSKFMLYDASGGSALDALGIAYSGAGESSLWHGVHDGGAGFSGKEKIEDVSVTGTVDGMANQLNEFGGKNLLNVSVHSKKSDVLRSVGETGLAWHPVAISASGDRIVAAEQGGKIYVSTDNGVTWSPKDSDREWVGIASSTDNYGMRFVALDQYGKIYTTTDGGDVWVPRDSNKWWVSVASSSDGNKLYATEWAGNVYTSIDAGINWTPRDSTRNWAGVACSSDGVKVVASVYGGQLYTSTNSGVNWTPRDSNRNWSTVASSSDGSMLFAMVTDGTLYKSDDSGVNWSALPNAPTPASSWSTLTSSSDGMVLVAGESSGPLYISYDRGDTWSILASINGSSDEWKSAKFTKNNTKLVVTNLNYNVNIFDFNDILKIYTKVDNEWRKTTLNTEGSFSMIDPDRRRILHSTNDHIWISRNEQWPPITANYIDKHNYSNEIMVKGSVSPNITNGKVSPDYQENVKLEVSVSNTPVDVASASWKSLSGTGTNQGRGGALAYGDGYIYSFKGGVSRAFRRYRISNGTWEQLADAPADVNYGGAIAYADGYLYAFTGGDVFYRYDIVSDSWEQMASSGSPAHGGASLTYGDDGYIYGIPGDVTTDFLRYSIATGAWESLTNCPAAMTYGGCSTFDGNGHIYALQGGTQNVYRYDIAGDSWENLASFGANEGDGASIAYGYDGYLYALRGDSTETFRRYEINGNGWESLPDYGNNVGEGGSLVYAEGKIYGTPGTASGSHAFRSLAIRREKMVGISNSVDSSYKINISESDALNGVEGDGKTFNDSIQATINHKNAINVNINKVNDCNLEGLALENDAGKNFGDCKNVNIKGTVNGDQVYDNGDFDE